MKQEFEFLYIMKGKVYVLILENRHREPPLTSVDIQNEFAISKSTASEHLSDLKKRGLIIRKRVGKHKHIYPSDFGD